MNRIGGYRRDGMTTFTIQNPSGLIGDWWYLDPRISVLRACELELHVNAWFIREFWMPKLADYLREQP